MSVQAHIMVVDDEEDLCEILRFNLEAEGYAVSVAYSAEEALARLLPPQGMPPLCCDLVLLDVMMERMSGFDMLRCMRSQGLTVPVIFLTARTASADELQGFSEGADDYIAKPFAFATVLARVKAVLRRSAAPVSDAPTSLTRREHLIWQLLCSRPGHFFSRADILAAVWPDDTLVGERSVDVHIARLRKKLGHEASRIVGKTGYGYGVV